MPHDVAARQFTKDEAKPNKYMRFIAMVWEVWLW